MASPSRRYRLRFSEVLEQGEADVTENQNADEDGPHDLQEEEEEVEEGREEEEEEPEFVHEPKGVDSANFLSKLFWW